ncbi:MAG: T9SS type A sorting domain-containing protein [Cytophagales bacterium]|nr:T9SS type A sorting domain-containing protein [Cytophagales bacterium]
MNYSVYEEDCETLLLQNIKTEDKVITTQQDVITTDIKIFPNPTNGILNITGNINNVVIYNYSGQIQFNESFNQENVQLDLSDLKAGIYFIEVSYNGQIIREKLIIID